MLAIILALSLPGQSFDAFPSVERMPFSLDSPRPVSRADAPEPEPEYPSRFFRVSIEPSMDRTTLSGGSGTEADPYVIRTHAASEVARLAASHGPLMEIPLRPDTRTGAWALQIVAKAQVVRQQRAVPVSVSPTSSASAPAMTFGDDGGGSSCYSQSVVGSSCYSQSVTGSSCYSESVTSLQSPYQAAPVVSLPPRTVPLAVRAATPAVASYAVSGPAMSTGGTVYRQGLFGRLRPVRGAVALPAQTSLPMTGGFASAPVFGSGAVCPPGGT